MFTQPSRTQMPMMPRKICHFHIYTPLYLFYGIERFSKQCVCPFAKYRVTKCIYHPKLCLRGFLKIIGVEKFSAYFVIKIPTRCVIFPTLGEIMYKILYCLTKGDRIFDNVNTKYNVLLLYCCILIKISQKFVFLRAQLTSRLWLR